MFTTRSSMSLTLQRRLSVKQFRARAAAAVSLYKHSSLDTLGLSWIPYYCIEKAALNNIADTDHMEKVIEKAAKNAEKAAKKSTAKALMKGPPANVLKASACAKK